MSNKKKNPRSYPTKMKVEAVEYVEINAKRAKLVPCIIHVRRVREKQKDKLPQAIAMDETLVWKDMVSATTIVLLVKNNHCEVHRPLKVLRFGLLSS